MATTNVTIVGKIPGYGHVLDEENTFGKILLRDVTYIDLIPASYSVNMGMLGVKGDISNFYNYSSGNNASKSLNIFKDVIKNLAKHSLTQFEKGLDGLPGCSASTKNLFKEKATAINKTWVKTSSIRIMGTNDSTFTETISNNFQNNDSGSSMPSMGMKAMNKFMPSVNEALGGESMLGKFQNMGYENALDALTAASTQSGLISLLSGKALGVQFATPNTWQSSSYNSTLNLFIKLASPSGDPLSIYKNITLPILTMMAAGSPITVNGVTYAMPLIWDVRAYGITHFKIGAVAAMTISRGSYETVFNSSKQPLLVDVRLTIVPLMQDFAVQYTGGSTTSITKNVGKLLTTGKEEAGMVKAIVGTNITKILKTAYEALRKVFDQIAAKATELTGYTPHAPRSIYGNDGLGVQSPGDEIDGLMGIAYGGPSKDATQGDFMKLSEYPDTKNGYIKGFANSYTFKV